MTVEADELGIFGRAGGGTKIALVGRWSSRNIGRSP